MSSNCINSSLALYLSFSVSHVCTVGRMVWIMRACVRYVFVSDAFILMNEGIR